jgi:uridine kinase
MFVNVAAGAFHYSFFSLNIMPLVSLCGYPCSGKSSRAKELKEFIDKNHPTLSCKIVTDDGNSDEKKLRGFSI